MGNLIRLERLETGVAKLILDNPPLNVNSIQMTDEIDEALNEIASDPSMRAVVITGAGTRAFCAGSDVKEFPKILDDMPAKKTRKENQVLDRIENFQKPVICAISGYALGSGCEIAISCDFRFMAEDAKIGLPEIALGTFPAGGGLFRLPQLVGVANALEVMFFGEHLSAEKAKEIGLIDRIAPAGECLKDAVAFAERIAAQPAQAIQAIKTGVRASLSLSHEDMLEYNFRLMNEIAKTEDFSEGIQALIEKRKPRFK